MSAPRLRGIVVVEHDVGELGRPNRPAVMPLGRQVGQEMPSIASAMASRNSRRKLTACC
jgi:hypothetical protein